MGWPTLAKGGWVTYIANSECDQMWGKSICLQARVAVMVVSFPAFYSDDLGLNLAEVYSFYSVQLIGEKIQKRPRIVH